MPEASDPTFMEGAVEGGAKLRKVLSVQIVGCNPPT